MRLGRMRSAAVILGAAALLVAPAVPAHAYHCYSDVIGDCSVVQHMLEDLKPNLCLFMEKATAGVYDCPYS